jgi:succinate dehydrogenase/fumarate reductase flavoprotein subunit
MRAAGLTDPKEDAIRYMARYAYTHLYDAKARFLGLPENSYRLIEAMYDNGSKAIEHLSEVGALQTRPDSPYDYWDYCPENKAPYGRSIMVHFAGDSYVLPALNPATAATPAWHARYAITNEVPEGRIGAGAEIIRQMVAWLDKSKVPLLYEHRAVRLVVNKKREVVGVEATGDEQKVVSVRARKAVHFGTGGFTQNADLRLSFHRGPTFGSCGPMTNQGDLVYMATDIGAKLGNMQNAWQFQLVLDHVVQTPALATDLWFNVGDAMFVVNKYGRRVVNEKRPYNDRAEVHNVYDASHEEWTNLVLFYIFDDRVKTQVAGHYPIPPQGTEASHVVTAPTLAGLAKGISERLGKFASKIGGFSLDAGFAANLKETLLRFNRFAETGLDEDFGRGKARYDLQWHLDGGGAEEVASNDKPNKTMYPVSTTGPYHAILMVKGQADTNGGPVVDAMARVLSIRDQPIPGLYGAGNCIASPSGRAYWGAGGTIGPALAFGYIAGKNAAREPAKDDDLSRSAG